MTKMTKVTPQTSASLPRLLEDCDFAVINGNYALDAGLTTDDALAHEAKDSEAAIKYANVFVVRSGSEFNPALLVISQALTSPEMKTFIEETYKGAVAPAF